METATAPATETAGTTRWTILLGYFAAVVVAEIFIAIPSGPAGAERPYQPIGLGIHILLVFTLMFGSVVMEARDRTMAMLLVTTSLASLVRVFSLAVPPYVQRLRPKDLGLHFREWSEIPIQTAIAVTGIPLGVVEFEILKPGPWIPDLAFAPLVAGGLVIFLATGLSEELIFRGLLLKRAIEGLGDAGGLLFVTAIFASLHIFFLSAIDMVFVFSVGLLYGYVVLKTKNLWGAIVSHSLGNVILYLVAPFVFR